MRIPSFLQNSIKALSLNSPPSSLWKHLMFQPVCFSTRALNCEKAAKRSLFFASSYASIHRDASSMNVAQYKRPLWLRTGIGPWTSLNMRSRTPGARSADFGKGWRCCFPLTHDSQFQRSDIGAEDVSLRSAESFSRMSCSTRSPPKWHIRR